MFLSPADFKSDALPPVHAMVSTLGDKIATWHRPIFKAPPLEIEPPLADVLSLVAELPKLGRAASAL